MYQPSGDESLDRESARRHIVSCRRNDHWDSGDVRAHAALGAGRPATAPATHRDDKFDYKRRIIEPSIAVVFMGMTLHPAVTLGRGVNVKRAAHFVTTKFSSP